MAKEVWKTAGDERVCPTCRALEGQQFEAGTGPMPPIHPGCRCQRLPALEPITGRGGERLGPIQPVAGLTPRRAIPTGAPGPTVVEEFGGTSLVQPPLPPGGIKVSAYGRQVGAFPTGITGEFVPWQAGAMGPAQAPARERIPEMAQLRKEAQATADHLKEWGRQVEETRKVGRDLTDRIKGFAKPEAATPQGMLTREFEESRRAYARAGWQDPYAESWREMQAMAPIGREAGGVRPTAWDRWSIRGQIAGMRGQLAEMAPQNRQESLQSAVFALYAARRGWQLTAGTLTGWMGQYGGYDIAAQQAQFAMGGEMPTAMGPYQQQQAAQARMANLQASLGQSAWQNFGFLSGAVGTGQIGATPLTSAATLGLGLATPWMAAKLAGGALGMAGAQSAAGLMAGVVAPLAATAGTVLGGAALGGGISRMLGADVEPGLGGTLSKLWGYGKQAGFLGGRALAGGFRGLGIGPQEEEQWLQHQQWILGLMGLVGEQAQQQSPLSVLSEQQRLQLQTQATTVIGQAPSTRLMETLAERGPLMGFEDPTKYLEQLQALALKMGGMPGGAGMGGLLQRLAGAGPMGLLQAQLAAPMIGQMTEMFGAVPGGELGFAQTYAEQMTAMERRKFGQLLGGNRLLWSDVGRQIGRPDLVTMEEGGLPIYTAEMRGMQDIQTQQQRAYRDWQAQQQWTQMQATQTYTRGMWGLEDRQRALQYQQADWLYGFQQRQFETQGRQWYEQFEVGGRQQMESMALGRQIFEARVGYQAEDISQQRQRAATQYQWRMEDWAYGENVAQLQYGWRMEDLSESIRFATGREKWQLMKQQERTTISESMRREHSEEQKDRMEEQRRWEEEDFERAKQRNEELVNLQREQFEMQKRHWEEDREMALRHHEEDRQMQQEQMEKQREFYLQGRELDEERIQRQREHWELQQKWAMEAWERAREYNKEMDVLQDQYKNLQRQQEDVIANFQRMMTYTEELSGAFSTWYAQASMSTQQYREWHETQRGHQLGGFVEQNEIAKLHGGEYIIPAHGQPVIRGENKESLETLKAIAELIRQLVAMGQSSEQAVVIVETPNAQKAKQHALDLADQAFALWPS